MRNHMLVNLSQDLSIIMTWQEKHDIKRRSMDEDPYLLPCDCWSIDRAYWPRISRYLCLFD